MSKQARDFWVEVFNLEHANALISDCFWYIICKVFNPGQYEEYEELYLDRIAANYVSYTIVVDPEDNKKEREKKDRFFKFFYDIISQSVFFCLFFAFPKSRSKLDETLQRKLLNTFSHMFTGMEIHSAKTDHWKLELGAGNMMRRPVGDQKKKGAQEEFSLADLGFTRKKGIQKNARTPLQMQYSPLVQRYLEKH